MIKLCPFRKETIYVCGRNTSAGYPDEWTAHEGFCDCLQDRCVMWVPHSEENQQLFNEDGYCRMA